MMNRCKKLEKELYLATCSACCFFARKYTDRAEDYGVCRRFPKSRRKDKDDWCGEFVRRESK